MGFWGTFGEMIPMVKMMSLWFTTCKKIKLAKTIPDTKPVFTSPFVFSIFCLWTTYNINLKINKCSDKSWKFQTIYYGKCS